MNLIQIPFHDLRKIAAEGYRTRDAHLIESFKKNHAIHQLLLIDRPTTWLEILIKKKSFQIKNQKVLLSKNGMKLLEISANSYAITWVSNDILGQILHRKIWFRKKYASQRLTDFIQDSIEYLNMENATILSHNIFACDIFRKFESNKRIFDAWDDFVKIENYASIQSEMIDCYKTYAKYATVWTTNAEKNKSSFQKKYNVHNIQVITNGVDQKRFYPDFVAEMPLDLIDIQKPIFGFGGKITHLIDADLMKNVVLKNPEKNFVFVGQNLVPEILNVFKNLPNVYYLGDKHYDDYINYLANFDVCLVPYVEDKKSSGANTIKVYEYLAMGKKVVGTLGNGLEDLTNFLYVAKNADEFSEYLEEKYPNKSNGFDIKSHSWEEKAKQFLKLIN